jgi:hypothetical protein
MSFERGNTMRLAEKMLLNSSFYQLAEGIRHNHLGQRCALGLVEEDVKVRDGILWSGKDGRAEVLYPWIAEVMVDYPCNCGRYHPCGPRAQAVSVIAQIFNIHVMGDKTWTLERLADWIESVDPTPRSQVEAVESIAIRDEQTVGR